MKNKLDKKQKETFLKFLKVFMNCNRKKQLEIIKELEKKFKKESE